MILITDDMKTDWFPFETRPRHEGVYERQNLSTGMVYYARWDGLRWLVGCLYARDAERMVAPAVYKPWPWRGLKAPYDGETS